MISFEQVLLLEEKVESAVKKIEQLNAENAALRSKCAELSNALNAKSEQFSSFQSDQSKIEEGILKALSRLNAVENVILSSGVTVQSQSNISPVSESSDSVTQVSVQEPQNFQTETDKSPEFPEDSDSSQSTGSDIDFEFGESEPVEKAESSSLVADIPSDNTQGANPEQLANPSQPMFDIF